MRCAVDFERNTIENRGLNSHQAVLTSVEKVEIAINGNNENCERKSFGLIQRVCRFVQNKKAGIANAIHIFT